MLLVRMVLWLTASEIIWTPLNEVDLIDRFQLDLSLGEFHDSFFPLYSLVLSIHPEHLLSHLEQAKGAPQASQNEAVTEKATETPPVDPPVVCDAAGASTDSRRKARRGRKPKTAKAETPLVVVEEKDSAGKTMLSTCSPHMSLVFRKAYKVKHSQGGGFQADH